MQLLIGFPLSSTVNGSDLTETLTPQGHDVQRSFFHLRRTAVRSKTAGLTYSLVCCWFFWGVFFGEVPTLCYHSLHTHSTGLHKLLLSDFSGHQPNPARLTVQSGFLETTAFTKTTGNPGQSSFHPVGQKTPQDYGTLSDDLGLTTTKLQTNQI